MSRKGFTLLEAVVVMHRSLDRMQLSGVVGEPLDGRKFLSVGLHRQHQAGTDRRTIHENRARTANAVFAADVGAGEQQFVAQEIAQQHPGFDAAAMGRAVDL